MLESLRYRTPLTIATALVALAVAPFPAPAASAQTAATRFAHVLVLDGELPVADLDRADFRLSLDGHELGIVSFKGPDHRPHGVRVVADARAGWPVLDSAGLLIDSLPPGSCALLVAFDERQSAARWLRADGQAGAAAVAELQGGPSHSIRSRIGVRVERRYRSATALTLTEALEGAYANLGAPAERAIATDERCELGSASRSAPTAVVALTDASEVRRADGIDDLGLADAPSAPPLFVLASYRSPNGGGPATAGNAVLGRPNPYPPLRDLGRLATRTGGALFRAPLGGGRFDELHPYVSRQFRRLVAGLRAHYVIGYTADGDAADLRVQVAGDYEVITGGTAAAEDL